MRTADTSDSYVIQEVKVDEMEKAIMIFRLSWDNGADVREMMLTLGVSRSAFPAPAVGARDRGPRRRRVLRTS